MQIRPTHPSDLGFVMSAEQHHENAPYVRQWTLAQHENAIASPDSGHFMAYQQDVPVGYILLQGLQDPHQCVLLKRIVAVIKGQGYGRQMLRWVKAFTFEQLGHHRLWLDVVASNQRAQDLYRSEGFIEEGLLREAYKGKTGFEDMLVLSLLRSEYQTATATGK